MSKESAAVQINFFNRAIIAVNVEGQRIILIRCEGQLIAAEFRASEAVEACRSDASFISCFEAVDSVVAVRVYENIALRSNGATLEEVVARLAVKPITVFCATDKAVVATFASKRHAVSNCARVNRVEGAIA